MPISADIIRPTQTQSGEIARLHDELKNAQDAAESALCAMVDLYNPHLGGHGTRVVRLVDAFARQLHVPDAAHRTLRAAALYHDIGMLGIRRSSLFKPWSQLDDNDRNLILMHPEFGTAQIRSMQWLAPAAPIIAAHHEHWDGSGYPARLRGDAIPTAARILAVCDTYDEMMNKPAWVEERFTEDQVIDHLIEGRGRQYEPRVVETFLTMLETLAKEAQRKGPVEIAVTLNQLRTGHVLARDMVNAEGLPMLARGSRITDAHVVRLLSLRDSRAVVEPVWIEP